MKTPSSNRRSFLKQLGVGVAGVIGLATARSIVANAPKGVSNAHLEPVTTTLAKEVTVLAEVQLERPLIVSGNPKFVSHYLTVEDRFGVKHVIPVIDDHIDYTAANQPSGPLRVKSRPVEEQFEGGAIQEGYALGSGQRVDSGPKGHFQWDDPQTRGDAFSQAWSAGSMEDEVSTLTLPGDAAIGTVVRAGRATAIKTKDGWDYIFGPAARLP